MGKEIRLYFDDINEYINSALIHLKYRNLDEKEIIYGLLSTQETIDIIKSELINYLEYLLDKLDPAYENEVYTSITSWIVNLS